ncbi:hypothetical protein HMPREF3156_01534 [Neisseria sp. HMSC06F02]|nr:hypothetical protein HMPREF3156_01534 [Neisseria sp. HMSC06F02]
MKNRHFLFQIIINFQNDNIVFYKMNSLLLHILNRINPRRLDLMI